MATFQLLRFLGVLALGGVSAAAWGQEQATHGWGELDSRPRMPQTRAEADSIRQAYVASKGYTRYFNNFYRSPDSRYWRLTINQSFDEDNPGVFRFWPCPFIDSVTYRTWPGGYFADKNGVYYDTSEGRGEGVRRIEGASVATFRSAGCSTLALDNQHVYWFGRPLPRLKPTDVKVYTLLGECSERSQVHSFFVGSTAVYQEFKLLPGQTARNFKVPKGWKLAYPKGKRR